MISVRDRLLMAASRRDVVAARALVPDLQAQGPAWYNECMFTCVENNTPDILRIARMHSMCAEEQAVLILALDKGHWDCVKVLAEYVTWQLLPRYEMRIEARFPHLHQQFQDIINDPSILVARLRNEAQNTMKNVKNNNSSSLGMQVLAPVLNDEKSLADLLGRFSEDIHCEALIHTACRGTPATIDLVLERSTPASVRQAAEKVRGLLMCSKNSFDVENVQYFLSKADHLLLSQEVSFDRALALLRKI